MKIIITSSQFSKLINEDTIQIGQMKDYQIAGDSGMKGTQKFLGGDHFPKNLIYKVFEYIKLKRPNDSDIVSFENKIKSQNKIKFQDRKKTDDYLSEALSDCKDSRTNVNKLCPVFCNILEDLLSGDSDNIFSSSYGFVPSNKTKTEIEEKWTKKYKRSINCNAPKGFSQRAHCQGRKKRLKESSENDELLKYGYDIEGIKIALKVMSDLSETYGEGIPLDFSLHEYFLKKREFISKPILQLFIDVNTKNGEEYKLTQSNRHEISVELLHVLEMVGLYSDEKMTPYYNFHFNKRNLD